MARNKLSNWRFRHDRYWAAPLSDAQVKAFDILGPAIDEHLRRVDSMGYRSIRLVTRRPRKPIPWFWPTVAAAVIVLGVLAGLWHVPVPAPSPKDLTNGTKNQVKNNPEKPSDRLSPPRQVANQTLAPKQLPPQAVNDPEEEVRAMNDVVRRLSDPASPGSLDQKDIDYDELSNNFQEFKRKYPAYPEERTADIVKFLKISTIKVQLAARGKTNSQPLPIGPGNPDPVGQATENPTAVPTLDDLVADLNHMLKAKRPYDSPTVRAYRKRIESFRQANPGIADTRWPKLKDYLDLTELPEDKLLKLKPEVAALLAEATDPVIPANTEQRRRALSVILPLVSKLPPTAIIDPVILQFLLRARTPNDTLGMIVPAYFELATDDGMRKWATLVGYSSRSGVPLKVVLREPVFNERQNNYVNAINIAHQDKQHRVAVLGGLSCEKGQKDIDLVKKEILLWHQFYGDLIDGFYFAEQATDADKVGYFAEVFAYARSLRADYQIVACPGVPCDEGYLTKAGADILCISTGSAEPMAKPWMVKHAPSHFAAINDGIPTEEAMKERILRTAANHISWIYIADNQVNQLFQHIPSFMESQVTAIAELNAAIQSSAPGQVQKKAPPRKKQGIR